MFVLARISLFTLLVFLGSFWPNRALSGQGSSEPLLVGTKHTPPFAIKSDEGSWSGIAIDLWKEIARELDVAFAFKEFELQGLLDAVEKGTVDVGVAALTVTADRERRFDFSHPFYSTGLGIAVGSKAKQGWARGIQRFLSSQFLGVVGLLALLLFGVGALLWFVERKRNPAQFDGSAVRGIGSGFWWSAVTMTTVGYGDKAPVTVWGRLIAIVWMFAGIIMISSFTAAITSALTVTRLESKVRGPEDLPYVSVGTVSGTTSQAYLAGRDISARAYRNPMEGMRALAGGEIDALVYDLPILRYLINETFEGVVETLPKPVERQDYAMALPAGSRLRESINQALIGKVQEGRWREILRHYMGD